MERGVVMGGADAATYYADEEVVQQFGPVLEYIKSKRSELVDGKDVQTLASITAEVVKAHETLFGSSGSQRTVLRRWPVDIFQDFSVAGGVCTIVMEVLKFMKDNGIERLNLSAPDQSSKAVALMLAVDKALAVGKVINNPAVLLADDVQGTVRSELERVALSLGCRLVRTEQEATHVVSGPVHLERSGPAYRVVGTKGSRTEVHWPGTPDSRNSLIPTASVTAEAQAAGTSANTPQKPWLVCAQWLTDSVTYNELMNPADYAADDNERMSDSEFLTSIGVVDTAPGGRSKRKRGEDVGDASAAKKSTADMSSRKNPDPTPKVSQVEDIQDANQKRPAELKPPRNPEIQKIPSAAEAEDAMLEDVEIREPNKVVEDQQLSVVIPSTASWFDYSSLDEIEINALPEFFNGTSQAKAPEIYMAYRNFMIDTYRLNPKEYLTATACRRNLAGDVCSILRVHAFLEQWGLINYQVDYDTRPTPLAPPTASHFMVYAETPNGLVPHYADVDRDATPADRIAKTKKSTGGISSMFGKGIATDVYAPGGSADVDDSEWTDAETLALLEGIELYQDDWIKVAEHVNSMNHNKEAVRSQDDCLAAFVRLPIEDEYLDAKTEVGKAAGGPVPFARTENPLIATLTFLMNHVGPATAAAGARGALGVLAAEDGETNGKTNGDAAMDVDNGKTEDATKADAAKDELSDDTVTALCEGVLDSAAKKASLLARAEERKLKGLIAQLVEAQLEKIELKMRQFHELEVALDGERRSFALQRDRLMKERVQFEAEKRKFEAEHGAVDLAGPTIGAPSVQPVKI
eukprot:m.23198 g.23198  ORF g.23198 m.23198 type:complete len:806 (+) comp4062_c0_seq1:249-2666(+)